MDQDQIYYKLLSQDMESYIEKDDRLKVKYALNEWVYPKFNGSKLFIFDDYNDALLFGDIMSIRSRLFQCNAINPTILGNIMYVDSSYETKCRFWNGDYNRSIIHLPRSMAICCDAIKLIEEM